MVEWGNKLNMVEENQNLEKKKDKNWILIIISLCLFLVFVVLDIFLFFSIGNSNESGIIVWAFVLFYFFVPLTIFLLITVIFSWIMPKVGKALLFLVIVLPLIAIIVFAVGSSLENRF